MGCDIVAVPIIESPDDALLSSAAAILPPEAGMVVAAYIFPVPGSTPVPPIVPEPSPPLIGNGGCTVTVTGAAVTVT